MNTQPQRVDLWKRISAWLFDLILLACMVIVFALLLSWILGYDAHYQKLEQTYQKYADTYQVDRNMTQQTYDAMSQEQKDAYNARVEAADKAMDQDAQAKKAYTMVVNLTLVIASVSVLLGIVLMEFAIPLLFKNGQTLGKKAFGIALVRNDSVKITTLQLFMRTVLGKYAVETMIPVYLLILLFLGSAGAVDILLIGVILLVQVLCPLFTYNRQGLHDLMAGTAAVDIATQRIFSSPDELVEYIKQVHAERAVDQSY